MQSRLPSERPARVGFFILKPPSRDGDTRNLDVERSQKVAGRSKKVEKLVEFFSDWSLWKYSLTVQQ
jgi:hypothetical protein